MTDHDIGSHPDIETLAELADGRLTGRDAEPVRAHVESCATCRVEVRRMRRFETIDRDDALRAEARWEEAAPELRRALHERILPAVVGEDSGAHAAGRSVRPTRPAWRVPWLVPAAAAAAVLVVVAVVRFGPGRPGRPGPVPMRGGGAPTAAVVLQEPSGDVDALPAVFRWRSAVDHDYYTLEVFTTDLSKLYEATGIREASWATSDSLSSLLRPGVIYLWSVSGYDGLERVTVSPTAWFRATTGAESNE